MNDTSTSQQQEPVGAGNDLTMLFFIVFLVVYFLLQLVILPRLGIPT